VSEFEKKTPKKYYAQVLSFRANSQWKKRLKCADLILKNYDKKKDFFEKMDKPSSVNTHQSD